MVGVPGSCVTEVRVRGQGLSVRATAPEADAGLEPVLPKKSGCKREEIPRGPGLSGDLCTWRPGFDCGSGPVGGVQEAALHHLIMSVSLPIPLCKKSTKRICLKKG